MVSSGWPDKARDVQPHLKPYWAFRDELSIEDSLLLKGGRIIIPRTMRGEILGRIHASHQGIEKCILRAKACVYWPGINDDIEGLVKGCHTCQRHQKSQPKETLLQHEIPSRPWQVVGVDLFHLDGGTYLLMADYYSKFPIVRKMHGEGYNSADVVRALKSVFGEHGSPDRICSDNGPQFSSSAFRQFAKEWDFKHITSSPMHAQSNGLIERTVQTVKMCMKKAKESKTDIDMALLCLRTTPIDHKLPSPAELLYNREIEGISQQK